ncbi:MAG: N-acetylglucosamine-6-phosphate deacetylase, partial [Planctomycetes bacterium]|nr:N-acetylglucosamine-6-phosphate deacetylase [Planctomycetota bacterium]
MLIRAKHYRTRTMIDVVCENQRIVSVSTASTRLADREADWVAPALFDLQINGCLGASFNSPDLTVEQVRKVVDVCREHGIGGLLPTLVTNSFDALQHGFATLSQAIANDPVVADSVPGFHLEGPYLSGVDGPRGAHPKEHIRPPNWDEFSRLQDAAGGKIRLVTLAPEHDGAIPFIERLVKANIVVAIGHTAANGQQIRDAIAAGARLSTHLGNGSHAMLPRHDNYIWEQLAADELWASLIPDGHHLPPALVKSIVRVKTPARAIITCDASSLLLRNVGAHKRIHERVVREGHVDLPDQNVNDAGDDADAEPHHECWHEM